MWKLVENPNGPASLQIESNMSLGKGWIWWTIDVNKHSLFHSLRHSKRDKIQRRATVRESWTITKWIFQATAPEEVNWFEAQGGDVINKMYCLWQTCLNMQDIFPSTTTSSASSHIYPLKTKKKDINHSKNTTQEYWLF